ncbi:MAG: hypothetical protein SPH63_06735 [Candidatus Cryptobacteroides sp.]|nr:hypothetical protein [Alistipes sp.]MDD7489772.1 hypothetical protein [Bacteroides sp.]MDY3833802.1 hypothetical protein [Candidatus Cryptobacteroides sp.]MDY5302703.1 hypothetical protein [Candidatus Cryptobacteroides sp.]
MIDKLTAGMKSWIKQDYQDICESPAEYGIADLANEFGKIVDFIVQQRFKPKGCHPMLALEETSAGFAQI